MCAGPGYVPAVLVCGFPTAASFLSSGTAPEDQALYVCEARNVFGKAQAEARLLVTGHGLWVNLEGVGSGRQVLQPGCGYPGGLLVATALDQCIRAIVPLLLALCPRGQLSIRSPGLRREEARVGLCPQTV